jgi:hypothetical protein
MSKLLRVVHFALRNLAGKNHRPSLHVEMTNAETIEQ